MQDDVVHYAGQPVALVVAEEYEQAQYAASLVRLSYETAPSITTIDQGRDQAYEARAAVRRADARRGTSAATSRPPWRSAERAGRGRLPDGRQPSQPARGPVDGRRVGRRPADAPRVDPGHPRHAADGGPAARPADRPRPGRSRQFVGGGFGVQGDGVAERDAHRDGRAARRPAGEADAHPAADVHVQRAPRGAGAAHHARRRRGRAADRDPAREAVDHLAVRRLGRAGDRRLVAAVRAARTTSACTG